MLRLSLILGLVAVLAGNANAGELVPSAQPMSTTVEREPVDTVVPFYRAYITADDQKFAFMIPEKYRLSGDPAHGKLLLENAEGGGLVTFTFLKSSDSDPAETGREAYRRLLESRYPRAKFLKEFPASAAGQMGLGFEVQWTSANGIVQKTRAVYLPTKAGLLELTATRSITNAPEMPNSLDEIVRSFSASNNGTLVVHHIARSN